MCIVKTKEILGHFPIRAQKGVEFLIAVYNQKYIKNILRHQIEFLAYILATVYWETAHTFQPIKEMYGHTQAQQKYWNTGYYGRGYVQLTWQWNYAKFAKLLNIDLLHNPNLALVPEYAADILYLGMLEGHFSGHKLSEFITDSNINYVGARKIVNGLDHAREIAKIANEYASYFKEACHD